MAIKNFVINAGDLDIKSEGLTNVGALINTHTADIAQEIVDRTAADADLQAQINVLATNADSDVLDIKKLRQEADSDTVALQDLSTRATAAAAAIQYALAALDSDGFNLQAIRTELEAEIAATDADVAALTSRLDSDELQLQSIQEQVLDIKTDDLPRIKARLDSDSAYIQGLDTRLRAEIAATNTEVTDLQARATVLEARADSDELAVQDLDTRLRAEIAATDLEVTNLQSQITSNDGDISDINTLIDSAVSLDTIAQTVIPAVNELHTDLAAVEADYVSKANGGVIAADVTMEAALFVETGVQATDGTDTIATWGGAGTTTITSTAATTLRSLTLYTGKVATITVQANSNGEVHMTTLNIVHNGTDIFWTEFGTIDTNGSLFDVTSVTQSAGQVSINVTPASAAVTEFRTNGTVFNV